MDSYSKRIFHPQTQTEAREVREALRGEYGTAYDALCRLLFEVDTHELSFGDNVDEYERVVWEALPALSAEQSDKEITTCLEEATNRVLAEPLSVDARQRLSAAAPRVRAAIAQAPSA
jgi:hypothetical protein